MFNVLIVGLGGMIGAVLRFLVLSVGNGTSLWIINGSGSFALGLLNAYVISQHGKYKKLQLFLGTGMLGAFTTFSTFSADWFNLLSQSFAIGILYSIGMTLMCVILSMIGVLLGKGWREKR